MISTGKKTLILFGSVYLLATSLYCVNDIMKYSMAREMEKKKKQELNKN